MEGNGGYFAHGKTLDKTLIVRNLVLAKETLFNLKLCMYCVVLSGQALLESKTLWSNHESNCHAMKRITITEQNIVYEMVCLDLDNVSGLQSQNNILKICLL